MKLLTSFLTILMLTSGISHAQEVYGPVDEVALYEKQKQERQDKNVRKAMPGIVAWEIVQVLDTVTTIQCGRNPNCEEVNAPNLYGRKPTVKSVLRVKIPLMIGGYFFSREIAKHSPVAAYSFLGVSGVITGKMVAGNINLLW